MVVLGCRQAKLHQDATHVLLDCSLGDVKATGDAVVGAAFRHEREHLALSRRELCERVVASARGHELLDESRVKY